MSAPLRPSRVLSLLFAASLCLSPGAASFTLLDGETPTPFQAITNNVIVPQIGACAMDGGGARLRVEQVVARVRIEPTLATTTLEISVQNLTGSHEAFEILVPTANGVEPGACAGLDTAFSPGADGPVTIQDVLAAGGMPAADFKSKQKLTHLKGAEARFALKALASAARTPWPLEFAAHDLMRTGGFELAPNGQVTVHITYSEPITWEGNQAEYTLPRSESHDALIVPWGLDVRASGGTDFDLATAYSPTHEVTVQRQGPRELRIQFVQGRHPEPGPISLAILRAQGALTGGVMQSPRETSLKLPVIGLVAEGQALEPNAGTFLLHTGFAPDATKGLRQVAREITLVLDRSGSMNNGKLDQARAAALNVLDDLAPGEFFNIISYSTTVVDLFDRAAPANEQNKAKGRDFLYDLTPSGGTNINDALTAALLPAAQSGSLPLLLFLTDGLPTSGEKDERRIGSNASNHNKYNRRIFTFGVGHDVNAPLLDHLASGSGGSSHYIRPTQDVEERIGEVFAGLRGPVLMAPVLHVLDANGAPAPGAVRYVLPARLPDLYEDDHLVIAGQYMTDSPLIFRVTGQLGGQEHSFDIPFHPKSQQVPHDFVPALWASRQLAAMVESFRAAGSLPPGAPRDLRAEAARAELILALSTRYGILNEYTAFLSLNGTDLWDRDKQLATLATLLRDRAQLSRVGRAAVSQSMNSNAALSQETLNRLNRFIDGTMNEVQIASVRRIKNRAFFLRGETWIDSGLAGSGPLAAIDEYIPVGSERYFQLVDEFTQLDQPGLISMPGNILLMHGSKVLFLEAVK